MLLPFISCFIWRQETWLFLLRHRQSKYNTWYILTSVSVFVEYLTMPRSRHCELFALSIECPKVQCTCRQSWVINW
jgi:hypothetical protein